MPTLFERRPGCRGVFGRSVGLYGVGFGVSVFRKFVLCFLREKGLGFRERHGSRMFFCKFVMRGWSCIGSSERTRKDRMVYRTCAAVQVLCCQKTARAVHLPESDCLSYYVYIYYIKTCIVSQPDVSSRHSTCSVRACRDKESSQRLFFLRQPSGLQLILSVSHWDRFTILRMQPYLLNGVS